MQDARSRALFAEAVGLIPGGVNSPVRACVAVGGQPRFIARGDGGTVTDVDNNQYVDFIGSWGPMILGHRHPRIIAALQQALAYGTSFGAPTEIEVTFARTLTQALPSMEKVRAVSSGTEATMSALRLARGFTGRTKIIKADGGYHGHADCLLVAAGSGAATLGLPGSAGVPPGAAADTLVVPYNDVPALEACLLANPGQVAALILEPVAGNMGVVEPESGYLQQAQRLCKQHGALLIFDEVMTGFRVAYGGAQRRYGITPDLTTIGKIVGGGLPAAAFGGRADIMNCLAPLGPVYQAGTLSGNPLAMAAGVAAMELCAAPGLYERLEGHAAQLEAGLRWALDKTGTTGCINRVGSMLTLFFAKGPVRNYAEAKAADTGKFASFYQRMRDQGVMLPPSQFEAMFVSAAHTSAQLDATIAAAARALT